LLAHKAHKEARIAVENICGHDAVFESIIPAVVFTDPELAWCGLTEAEARERGLTFEISKFPWSASGRALSFDRTDGLTKMIIDQATGRVLGVGIVGAGAGELIAEAVLAMEMGATVEDIALSIHPHPTLSETLMECAEAFYGHATHAVSKRRAEE
jgi:dihydrolipoamide dehydrogenase